jgi:hypothetical protein
MGSWAHGDLSAAPYLYRPKAVKLCFRLREDINIQLKHYSYVDDVWFTLSESVNSPLGQFDTRRQESKSPLRPRPMSATSINTPPIPASFAVSQFLDKHNTNGQGILISHLDVNPVYAKKYVNATR